MVTIADWPTVLTLVEIDYIVTLTDKDDMLETYAYGQGVHLLAKIKLVRKVCNCGYGFPFFVTIIDLP